MNGEIYQIDLAQLEAFVSELPHTAEEKARLMEAGRWSVPRLAGVYHGELLALIGFIPLNVFSTDAYIWVHATDAVANHRLVFARHALAVVSRATELYPRLVGVCLNERSKYWLLRLGATFSTATTFEIRRA